MNAVEPAAWGVMRVGGRWVSILCSEEQAETGRKSFDVMENWVHVVRPLYEKPQPTLTDEEREALGKVLRRLREDYFAGRFADSVEAAAVIDGLLERTK
jgi:hypothetical protein